MPETGKTSGKQPRKKLFQRYMIRPTVYKIFTRFILALTASLLWDHFVNAAQLSMRAWAFVFFGILFIVCAWLCYLRLDGVRLPRIKKPELKKKPVIRYGDLPDYIEEEVISFSELEEEERDLCCLIADTVLGIAFLALSFL